MTFTIAEIAERCGGEVIGDGARCVTGIAAAQQAGEGDLTFADKEEYLAVAEQGAAAAVIVPADTRSAAKTLIRVRNPRIAVARLLPLFFPPELPAPGIDPSAKIASSATVDPTAHIGPGCVIADGCTVGARTVLMGGNHLGKASRLGDDVCLFPNVTVYSRTVIGNRVTIHAGTTIGSDGYGYVFDEGRHRKVLQVGNVVIGDDVEIGANCAIDRAALGSTTIGSGTKIDNLVHIAHNVVVGRHCLVMGQVGFAGSTELGDYGVVASQSGIAGHLKLGVQSTVGAKSGVMRDVPAGGTVLGIPAMPDKQTKRQWIAVQQLPELVRRMRALERELAALRSQIRPVE